MNKDARMKIKQISARISMTTKDDVEEFLRSRGLKQNRFIEDALRHYLRVLRTLPDEARISSSLIFTNQSFEEIVHSLQNPSRPTAGLINLMRGEYTPEDGLY